MVTPRRLPHISPIIATSHPYTYPHPHPRATALHPTRRTTRSNLQILSDVRIGKDPAPAKGTPRSNPRVTPNAKNLALLGNIGRPFHSSYTEFIGQQSRAFENVFVLLDRYEYGTENEPQRPGPLWQNDREEVTRQAESVCRRFHNVHLLDQAVFDLTPDTRLLGTFREDRQTWLTLELERCQKEQRRAVILSTRIPCAALITHPAVAIATGSCPHSYSTCDFRLNGVRIVSNGMGKEDMVIDID